MEVKKLQLPELEQTVQELTRELEAVKEEKEELVKRKSALGLKSGMQLKLISKMKIHSLNIQEV